MILKIYDDIITDQQREEHRWCCGTDGVTFGDIDAAVAAIPEDDPEISLLINCVGGSVSEGWAIVDKLRATGKKITATVDGMCASMAVSVLLAASERRAQPHATLHIHKPYIPPFTLADAYNEDQLRKIAEDLERETAKMLDWYVERTGADRERLAALMGEDININAEDALALGFVHEIVPPISASMRGKEWNKSQNFKNMANTKAGVINALANLLGVKVNVVEAEAVNYVIMTADGSELSIEKPEGEEPAVGDVASPDGEHVLEDGRVIVVAEGVITEIREAEAAPAEAPEAPVDEADAEDVEAVKAENEALKVENEELKAKVAELEAKLAEAEAKETSAEDKATLATVAKCGGASWLAKVAQSNYSPAQRKQNSVTAPVASGYMAKRMAELSENRENRK